MAAGPPFSTRGPPCVTGELLVAVTVGSAFRARFEPLSLLRMTGVELTSRMR